MGRLFRNMVEIANANPAHVIYRIAIMRTEGLEHLSMEELKEKLFAEAKGNEFSVFGGTFKEFYDTHAGSAKFTPEEQKKLKPEEIQRIKDLGLGIFLWEELTS